MSFAAQQVVEDTDCFLCVPVTSDVLDSLADNDVNCYDTDLPLSFRLSQH
jgi:hypothetical protein